MTEWWKYETKTGIQVESGTMTNRVTCLLRRMGWPSVRPWAEILVGPSWAQPWIQVDFISENLRAVA